MEMQRRGLRIYSFISLKFMVPATSQNDVRSLVKKMLVKAYRDIQNRWWGDQPPNR